MPRETSIEVVKTAIKSNPYAADLHANLLKLYAEEKNMPAVQEEFHILQHLVPQTQIVKTLTAAGLK